MVAIAYAYSGGWSEALVYVFQGGYRWVWMIQGLDVVFVLESNVNAY